eukprot:CFRG2794T1
MSQSEKIKAIPSQNRLTSLCVSLIENPSVENFQKLNDAIHSIHDTVVLDRMREHIQLTCVSFVELQFDVATETQMLSALECIGSLLSGISSLGKTVPLSGSSPSSTAPTNTPIGHYTIENVTERLREPTRINSRQQEQAHARTESFDHLLKVLVRVSAPPHMLHHSKSGSHGNEGNGEVKPKADEIVCASLVCLTKLLSILRCERETESAEEGVGRVHTDMSVHEGVGSATDQREDTRSQTLVKTFTQTLKQAQSSPSQPSSIMNKHERFQKERQQRLNVLLPYTVAVLLAYVEVGQRNRQLKEASLRALCELVNFMLQSEEGVGMMARVLPGMVTVLARVICASDSKQGRKVTCLALNIWGTVIIGCVGNDNLSRDVIDLLRNTNPDKRRGNAEPDSKNIRQRDGHSSKQNNAHSTFRDVEWVTTTCKNVIPVIEKICTVCEHPNVEVRVEFAALAMKLLVECSVTLSDSQCTLMDVLVRYTYDTYSSVSERARAYVSTLSRMMAKSHDTSPNIAGTQYTRHTPQISQPSAKVRESAMRMSQSVVEERLHDLILSIPRYIRTMDDANKLASIRLVRGYVALLGTYAKAFFSNELHLNLLIRMLTEILAFDDTSTGRGTVQITGDGLMRLSLADHTSTRQEFTRTPPPLRKQFKYFRDEKVTECIRMFCRELRHAVGLDMFCEKLIPILQSDGVAQRQSCFILTEMILGDRTQSGSNLTDDNTTCSFLLSVFVEKLTTQNMATWPNTIIDTSIKSQTGLAMNMGVSGDNGRSNGSSLLLLDDTEKQYSVTPVQQHFVQVTDEVAASGSGSANMYGGGERVVLTCLLLEGIYAFVLVNGKEFEARYMMLVLYPLLESVGSDVAVIRASATYVLRAIQYYGVPPVSTHTSVSTTTTQSQTSTQKNESRDAHTTAHTDVQTRIHSKAQPARITNTTIDTLIRSNIDYVIDTVSHNLMYPEVYPFAPTVLKVILDNSTADVLYVLSDVLAEMMDRVACERPIISQYLPVFVSIVTNIHKWMASGELEILETQWHSDPLNTDPRDHANQGTDETDEKTPRKPYLAIAKLLMDICEHFTSDEYDINRMQVLYVIEKCFYIIRDVENELLPMVHRFWPLLLLRLRDRNPHVRIRSLKCVMAIIETSTWFAKQRVMEDLIPILKQDLGVCVCGVGRRRSNYKADMGCGFGVESTALSFDGAFAVGVADKHGDAHNKMCGVSDEYVFMTDKNGNAIVSQSLSHQSIVKGSSVYAEYMLRLIQCVVTITQNIEMGDGKSTCETARGVSSTVEGSSLGENVNEIVDVEVIERDDGNDYTYYDDEHNTNVYEANIAKDVHNHQTEAVHEYETDEASFIVDVLCRLLWPYMNDVVPSDARAYAIEGFKHIRKSNPRILDLFLRDASRFDEHSTPLWPSRALVILGSSRNVNSNITLKSVMDLSP